MNYCKLMNNYKVSIIIPTRDCADMLKACLLSIRKQTYHNLEVIVVDGNSNDNTREVASSFGAKVLLFPELGDHRSEQRNMGVREASGELVVIIDSDMELEESLVADCVEKMSNTSIKALIIPERSFGQGFWSKCKALEKEFYVNNDWIEAARFFRKDDYLKLGGYNKNLTSGEDWDLSDRFRDLGRVERVKSYINHNEGRISLTKTVKKKFFYAKKISKYFSDNKTSKKAKTERGVLKRYCLFFSRPGLLFKNPVQGIGMLFMKTCEYFFGGLGYVYSKKGN